MMGFSFSSLRARLLLLVLLAVIPALGLILYTAAEQRRSAALEAQASALRLARSVSSSQDGLIEGARQLLTALAQMPFIQSDNPSVCNSVFSKLLKEYKNYANLGVNSLDGDPVCGGLLIPGRFNFADRSWFQGVMKTGDFFIGEYQVGRITHKATLGLGYPVRDETGRLKAILYAGLDLNWLNALAAKTQLPSGASLSVIDRKGTIIVRYPDPEKWVGQPMGSMPLAKTVLAQGEGMAEAPGVDGLPRLYGFTPLGSGTPAAYVTIGIPKDLAIAAANRILVRNLAGLGIVGVLALMAAWFGADFFVLRRVKVLTNATKRLSEGDLSARTGLSHGQEELGQLAQTFDMMAEALQARVAERTAAEARLAALHEQTRKQTVELEKANEDLKRREEIQKLLKELSQDITSLDIDSLLRKLAVKVREFLKVDVADVRVLEGEHWYVRGVSGMDPGAAPAVRGGTAQRRTGWILRNRRPLVVSDITRSEHMRADGTTEKLGIRAFLGVPIFSRGGEVIGILRALTYQPREFTQEEVDLLQQLANGAAVALENAQLVEQIRKQTVELEKANKVKDEFLRFVSHELRTPINAVLGYAAMIQDGLYGEVHGEQRETLGKIISRSHDLLSMVNTLLEATRIEAGRVRLEKDEVNLSEFLGEVRSTYDVRLDKELTLIWNYPSDLSTLETDKDKLRHILQNLINNAIKYTDKGSVTVSARPVEKRGGADGQGGRGDSPQRPSSSAPMLSFVEFRVTDTGIGIPKESLTAVFEMFRQVKGSRSGSRGGVGLGLHIVKKFTELIGGEIEVESAPGKGSTFTVTIPCESDPSAVNVQRSVVYSGKSV